MSEETKMSAVRKTIIVQSSYVDPTNKKMMFCRIEELNYFLLGDEVECEGLDGVTAGVGFLGKEIGLYRDNGWPEGNITKLHHIGTNFKFWDK